MRRRSFLLQPAIAGALPALPVRAQDPGGNPMDRLLLKDWNPASSLIVPVTSLPRPRYPAIDVHTHAWFSGRTPEMIAEWVKGMDDAGVEAAIVGSDAFGAAFDRIAGMFQPYGKRFVLSCAFDNTNPDEPGYPDRAVRELERCVKMGARGVGELSDKGWGLESGVAAYLATRDTGGHRKGPPRSRRMHLDDPRLDAFWHKCAELGLPVSLHIADHPSCWQPLGPEQERPPAFAHMNQVGKDVPSYEELMARRDRLFERHPRTTFIACHLSNQGNDLAAVSRLLDRFPHVYVEIGARDYELGRQPRFAAKFLERYKDRVLFGTDSAGVQVYRHWWRLLETDDDYLPGPTGWRLYGLRLPDPVLRAVYRDNAKRVLNWS